MGADSRPIQRPIYGFEFKAEDDLSLYRSLIYQYSTARVVRGYNAIPLRQQLVALLAIYFKMGYNKESKEFASAVFNIKMGSINTMNLELKESGYLIEDPFDKRVKTLNPELQELRNYVDSVEDGNYLLVYRITINQDKR